MKVITIIIWTIFILWIVFELLMICLKKGKNQGEDFDKMNSVLVWMINTTGFVVGLYYAFNIKNNGFGSYEKYEMLANMIGFVLVLAGIIVRWSAIRTLNANFSYTLTIRDEHELIQSGIYKIIRHPSYTGCILSFLGLGTTFLNWVAILIFMLPGLFAFIYRIKVEEKFLINYFGEQYISYSKSTYKLFPYIF